MPDRIVFVNGKVFVGDAARSWARAVAVESGLIVAVGNESAIEPFVAGAEVIDLEGRLLCPGFTDAHVHPHHGGSKLLACNLLDALDREEATRTIAEYVAAHPGDGWVTGGGWSQDWFANGCPSATELDAIVGDRPAFLGNRDGHGAWASSAALARAGVTASTPDPTDGRIERLSDGSPQGTMHEGAMDLVEGAMPTPTDVEHEAFLRAGQEHLLSFGITGWMDAWVDEAVHRAYRSLASRGELVGSVVGALWWDRGGGMEQLERLRDWREEGAPGYRPTAVKLMLDGVVENYTAAMLEPYAQVGGRGIDMIDPTALKEIVTRLDALGFQCHFHAIGDAAVRNGLDAVEMARITNGWSGQRHSISHLQVVHPDDIPRFHRLGVTANIQPLWACEDGYQAELTQPFLGPERSRWQYPFGSLVASGATIAGGSDWSVSTCDVMEQVHVAVNRVPAADPTYPPLTPEQRIDPVTALAAYTAGSAWHNHEDHRRGSISLGNVADLVVLDGDPWVDGSFATTSVAAVLAGGGWAYREEKDGEPTTGR